MRRHLRISKHFAPWIERARNLKSRTEARALFEKEIKEGNTELDILKAKLLPYQQDGMIHLAFGERSLLADEMGLGKTIQAIAACELLRRRKNIRRVLVVCPASVKAEWEDQIARFTDQTSRLVFGPRAARLVMYAKETPALFTIVNYEQVLGDADDINQLFKPDVVILDEAQRIKNWPTKTAQRVKSLRAPYAFVLTGTPVENRIDEVYSIIQYLDPEIFGPLFRFNRDFYELDERGRPIAFKNMGELNRRLKNVMLRRRKKDVETQLPGRTVQNFFVRMEPEQQLRYDDYNYKASILIAQGQKRPLSPKEFEILQMYLACMRMLCDTPAILDPKCRISPKLEELENILADLLQDKTRKVIIFSEWERMLELVRGLADELGVAYAWHTGSVPQHKRRDEISKFKSDAKCRLFLSTDAGATGLNLQVASAVINVDLPWNPAKLEQRIARAWRKNQTRSVSVINLVTENSIEHNILHLLSTETDDGRQRTRRHGRSGQDGHAIWPQGDDRPHAGDDEAVSSAAHRDDRRSFDGILRRTAWRESAPRRSLRRRRRGRADRDCTRRGCRCSDRRACAPSSAGGLAEPFLHDHCSRCMGNDASSCRIRTCRLPLVKQTNTPS